MDSVFLLGPEARSRFLHSTAHSLGCVYICVWSYIPYPSNCLICSDGWFHEDHESRRLFDMYSASFCIVESGCVPGLAYKGGVPCIELADPPLLNLASTQIQRQFYQESGIKKVVFMGCKNGEIEFGMSNTGNINMQMIQQLFSEDQFPTDHQSRPSSSSSSLQSPSVSSPEYSSLLLTKAAAGEPSSQLMTMQAAYTQHQNIQFPTPASDDAAIMRAMLTVISSASSTASLYVDQGGGQSRVVRPLRAFKTYNAALTPINTESRQRLGGQRMIKMSIAILRKINHMRLAEGRLQEPQPPSTNQLHHMISERKRREKLNESFHALRMLLPPGSKKDKTSVLFNTRDYLNTLKDQVSELEERNRMLELQLLPDDHEIKEGGGDSNERIEMEIIRLPESSSSQVQRITLRITVRVEFDMSDLLLRVLECLKERGGVSLLSVNANTFCPQTGVNALNLSLQVEAGNLDERSLEEAVTRAVDSVVVARPGTTNR